MRIVLGVSQTFNAKGLHFCIEGRMALKEVVRHRAKRRGRLLAQAGVELSPVLQGMVVTSVQRAAREVLEGHARQREQVRHSEAALLALQAVRALVGVQRAEGVAQQHQRDPVRQPPLRLSSLCCVVNKIDKE